MGTGRLDEIDRGLVKDALETVAAHDGPRRFCDALRRLLFILAWPKRTYQLHGELKLALENLRGCLKDSPSMRLFYTPERPKRAWQLARFAVIELDDTIPEPPKVCPWPSVQKLLHAAAGRFQRVRSRFP